MEMLKRCLDMYEMPAVKMNGAQNAYYIDDERHFPIYAYLQEAGRGLAFHIGADFYDFTHPTRAAKVARAFPRLKILMVHMGGSGIPDLGKASIEAAQECPNMLLVGSMISHLRVIEAIQVLGPERLCFGSDAPFALMHAERAAYEAFLPDVVDPDGHALIMGENIRRFLTV